MINIVFAYDVLFREHVVDDVMFYRENSIIDSFYGDNSFSCPSYRICKNNTTKLKAPKVPFNFHFARRA